MIFFLKKDQSNNGEMTLTDISQMTTKYRNVLNFISHSGKYKSHYTSTRLPKWKDWASSTKDGEQLQPSCVAGRYGYFGKLWPTAEIHLILSEMHMMLTKNLYSKWSYIQNGQIAL